MKRNILAVVLAGLWITASEFLRNEFLVQKLWLEHYANLGINFVANPMVSGPLWMLWSFLFAGVIWRMLRSIPFWSSVATAWVAGFPMMWIPLYNMQVFPLNILWAAVPLSLLEVLGAAWIIGKLAPGKKG